MKAFSVGHWFCSFWLLHSITAFVADDGGGGTGTTTASTKTTPTSHFRRGLVDDPWEEELINESDNVGDGDSALLSNENPMDSQVEAMEEEIIGELLGEDGSMSPSAEEAVLEAFGLEDSELAEELGLKEAEEEANEKPEGISQEESVVDEEAPKDDESPEETMPQTTITHVEASVPKVEEGEESLDSPVAASEPPVVEAPPTGGDEEEGPTDPYAATSTTAGYGTSPHSNIARDQDEEQTEYQPPPIELDPLNEMKHEENIIADRWRTQEWKNKTPQELAVYAHEEADQLMNDKYVPLVAVAVSLVCFGILLFVVGEILEHPQGCLAKMCKCAVACCRILTWPIRMILCCGLCCGSSAAARKTDHELLSQGHRRRHSSDDMQFA